jgi:hypothetical protein
MTPNTLLQFAFHLAGPASPDRIAAESATLTPADWTDLLAFLKKQGLAPPLYDRIIQLHYDQVLPPDFVAELRAIYLNNAVRNLYAQRQLSQILAALESNQISVILLKGAAFAFSIYQNPACRMMSDLDLLVHQDHLTRVTSIFETLGYQLSGTAWQGPGHHLPPFFRPASLFPVELHWQLTTPNRSTNLSPDLIWNTAQSGSCFAHACCQLSPALALFHVCQHAAYQHLFASSPRAIFDIDTLLRADPDQLDWPAFWGYAETTACLPGVAFLLQLTAQLLSTPLPTPALARILAVTLPKGIQQDVYEVMLSGEELPDTPPSGLGPAVGWGFRKAGKLWRSLFLTRHPSAAGPAAPAPGLRRAGHLLKDQLSAARNLFRVNPNQPGLKTNRRLRRWLKIS